MKNKKKLLTIALSAVLLLGGAAFTYAYFTDSKEQTNVITMGNVGIELDEPLFSAANENNTITNVYPNQSIVKDPTITLKENSNDAYVRALITYTGNITEAQQAELEDGIKFKAGWVKGTDGYYYYNTALTQVDNTVLVFGEVTIPENWGNEMISKTFNIVVKAEAIQKDNFTPQTTEIDGKTMINGWVDSKGNTITAS